MRSRPYRSRDGKRGMSSMPLCLVCHPRTRKWVSIKDNIFPVPFSPSRRWPADSVRDVVDPGTAPRRFWTGIDLAAISLRTGSDLHALRWMTFHIRDERSPCRLPVSRPVSPRTQKIVPASYKVRGSVPKLTFEAQSAIHLSFDQVLSRITR